VTEPGLRSIATNASYLFAARSVTAVLRVFYLIVLARAFGPELYGLLAYGQSWYGVFVPLTTLGFGVLLAREVRFDRTRGQAVAVRMFALRGPLTIVAAVMCAGIGWAANAEPTVQLLLYIFSVALIGRAMVSMTEDTFAAFEISAQTFRQEVLFRPVEVGLGFAILAAGGGIFEIAGLHAAVQIAQGMRGLVLVRRHLDLPRVPMAWQAMCSLLAKALSAGAAGLIAAWLLQGPLVLYSQSTADRVGVGQLALVLQALVLLCNLPWAIGRSALPVLSDARARRDGSGARYAEAMLRLGFALATALGLAGMAIGPWLMTSVFGTGYALAGTMLGPALWLLLPLTAATALNPLLMVRERYGAAGVSALLGAGVMSVAVFVLAPNMGPAGAIAGAGVGLGVWALSLLGVIGRHEGIALGLAVVRPGIVAAMALFTYLTTLSIGVGALWCLILAWLVLLLAGVSLCLVAAERRALAALWRSAFRPAG